MAAGWALNEPAVWPGTPATLIEEQTRLGALASAPEPLPPGGSVGGCFVCFSGEGSGPGFKGDPGWAAAAVPGAGDVSVVRGTSGAAYQAGLLALREGPLLEQAVRALAHPPEVLVVNATGRDHPRRCGLAFHLGAVLELPTVGVTHRPLLAEGTWPSDARGATAPLLIEGALVGFWVRTRTGARPVAAHAAWRTSADEAVEVVLRSSRRFRTPEPLRRARQLARQARTAGQHAPS